MSLARVEELVRSAEDLTADEALDLAQRLIERARQNTARAPAVDLNALAGSIRLDEDPMEIQERMRSEWQ